MSHRSVKVSCQSFGDVDVAGTLLQDLFDCSNCPFCSSIALKVVWAGCYVPNIKLVTKASEVVRSNAWAIVRMIFSGSPNFMKILFNTLVVVSVVMGS